MPGTVSQSRRMVAYAGILIINFLAMYLISGVGVYSYTVAEVFNNLPSVSMVFTLECVARGVSIPIGGKVGDKVGHKKLFLFAVTLYIICYAVAAFATSFWMFTIARMVSGFAWGLFMMNGFVLLSAIFGQADAPKYSGYNQSLTTVAMIIGAPIAGVVCAINWRLQFYVALVLLVIGLALCAYGIPTIPPKSGENSRLDLPGVIATEMNAHLSPEDLEALADETPLGRIGTPEECATCALFLASEGASFVTGQVLAPNGGLVI